jgi:hypothetical protein
LFIGLAKLTGIGDVKKPIKATEEGPFKEVDIDKVPKQPSPLPEGFEWVTTDINDKNEVCHGVSMSEYSLKNAVGRSI